MAIIDKRTADGMAKYEREYQKACREHEEKKKLAAKARVAAMWEWRPIEECPFDALSDCGVLDGAFMVKNDKERALVSVSKRFGRPYRIVCDEILTDEGAIKSVSAENLDGPDWWLQWELTDEFGHYHELYGKPEINFIPTHWTPLPE